MNNVTLVGRLTRDPELRYLTGSGTPVANFGIAVDRGYTNKEGKKEVDFINIEVWNKSAENCANYISKGSLVGIQGAIRVDTYLGQQGERKSAVKVRANDIRFLGSKPKVEYQAQPTQPDFTPSMEPNFMELEQNFDIPFDNM